jgi:hypothetical protein
MQWQGSEGAASAVSGARGGGLPKVEGEASEDSR